MSTPKLTVFDLITRLQATLEKGFPILPNYLVAVKIREIDDLIDGIWGVLPVEVQEARAFLRRREELQIEAQQKAEKIVMDAQNEASRLLSESDLLRAVQKEAEIIKEQVIADCEEIKRKALEDAENFRNQAHDDAMRTREGAEAYAEQVLSSLEQTLNQHQQLVKNGQFYMEKLRTESSGGYDPLKHNYPQAASTEDFNKEFKID